MKCLTVFNLKNMHNIKIFRWVVMIFLFAGWLIGCNSGDSPTDPATLEPTVIVAVGDSITSGWGTFTGGYPAKLQEMLLAAGYKTEVMNAGVAGEASPATDERFSDAIAGADIALIMIGTNDEFSPDQCPNNKCETLRHIESMMDKAIKAGVTPVVGTVIHEQPYEVYLTWNWDIDILNEQIKLSAAKRKTPVADTLLAFLQYEEGDRVLYLDRHHPTEKGNEVLAQCWFDTLVNNKLVRK